MASKTPGSTRPPSQEELINQLTETCLEEFVRMLAPHRRPCEMELASCEFWVKGRQEVRAGTKWALAGDWSRAEENWRQAIAVNPHNHAALFNLSIAAARRQDYSTAETYALSALRVEHKDCYTAGLEQIRERRKACEQATAQRESRLSASTDSLAR